MARYRGPKQKLSRRERVDLGLKADPTKLSRAKRKDPPGPQNKRVKKLSEYGIQLREKQKTRRIYGILEKQFRNYYKKADRMMGITGEDLLKLLERRLDNVVYRLGFASTRAQARQFVTHAHILVNGKKVNIPSFNVSVGDEIALRSKSMKGYMKEHLENNNTPHIQPWLEYNESTKSGKVVAGPEREHIEYPINEQLIVEYYSK